MAGTSPAMTENGVIRRIRRVSGGGTVDCFGLQRRDSRFDSPLRQSAAASGIPNAHDIAPPTRAERLSHRAFRRLDGEAAVDRQDDAGDERSLVRGEEHCGVGDVLRGAPAPQHVIVADRARLFFIQPRLSLASVTLENMAPGAMQLARMPFGP